MLYYLKCGENMKIGLDLDDTIINTKEKLKIYWKEYYNSNPNKDYTSEVPDNINFFGYKYIEDFWNLYREELFYADIKKDASLIINKLQKEGYYLGLITSRPKEKYNNLINRIEEMLNKENIYLDEIITNIKNKADFLNNSDYDLLVDDSIINIESSLKIGKKAILFNKTNNNRIKHTTSWKYLYKIIKEYE